MILDDIHAQLTERQDISYRDFQSRLLPTVDKAAFIGVRTPALRAMAKRLARREDIGEFLSDLPHRCFDENQLHAFVIALTEDFDRCLAQVNAFLPYVDNWATCDQLSPKVFKKHKTALLPAVDAWIGSGAVYTVRFGVKMLMEHFLDDSFDLCYPRQVAAVRSEEYYVNMMIAWYFATALAKQYDAVLPFLEERRLSPWTHNKAIQKAAESLRVSPDKKAYLKTLRI